MATLSPNRAAAPQPAPADALDANFGVSGLVLEDFGATDSCLALLWMDDGRILAAGSSGLRASGDFLLARYLADGRPDPSFSGDGRLLANLAVTDAGNAVALQEDGRILLAGASGGDFALLRFNQDGGVDASFSQDGRLTSNFGASDTARDLAILADGRILLAGDSNANWALARYLEDGTADASFSGDGLLTLDLGGVESLDRVLALADGDLLLGGNSSGDFALGRLNGDGVWDAGFATGGRALIDFGAGSATLRDMAVQADGKILLAGWYVPGLVGERQLALARYDAEGRPDASFGQGGRLLLNLAPGLSEEAVAIQVMPDGRILLGGHAGGDFLLARLDSTGLADASLDDDGVIILSPGTAAATATAMVLGGDGGLYLAGAVGGDLALLRFHLGLLDQVAREDEAYAFTLADNLFRDPDGDVLTYSVRLADGAPLPGWLSFDAVSRRFSGTPDNASVGGLDIRVTARDPGGLSASDVFHLEVRNRNDAPVLALPLAAAAAREGQAFALALPAGTFVDEDAGDTLRYALHLADGGAAPSWLSADPLSGRLAGLPEQADVGVFDLRITATDSGGLSAAAALRLTVENSNDAPEPTPAGSGAELAALSLGYAPLVTDLRLQTDGAILVSVQGGGDLELIRLGRDGAWDSSFSGDGRARVDYGGTDRAQAVAVQADGAILAAAESADGMRLARFDAQGVLDTAFTSGTVLAYNVLHDHAYARALAVAADGGIVLAGSSDNGSHLDFGALRLGADGRLDSGFGLGGRVHLNASLFVGYNNHLTDMLLLPDGDILLAGYTGNPRIPGSSVGGVWIPGTETNNDFSLVRLNANGALDTGFSGDGRVTTSLGSDDDRIQALALQSDGKIVAAGDRQGNGGYDYALVRYNPDGSLDAGFGGDGVVTSHLGAADHAYAAAIQADGKILVAGTHLLRYNGDGSLDAGFSGDGVVSLDMTARALALEADGGILVAGERAGQVVLARYSPGGMADQAVEGAFQFSVPSRLFQDEDGDILSLTATLADGAALPGWLAFDPANRRFSGDAARLTGALALRVTAADPDGLTAHEDFLLHRGSLAPRFGDAGDNALSGGDGADCLDGGDGADTLRGGGGGDLLLGAGGGDQLWGQAGNDSLLGGEGHDRLDGGAGADTLAGGNGNDVYVVDHAADVVRESVGGGVDTVRAGVFWSLLPPGREELEHLTLTGAAPLQGIGNAKGNRLTGNVAGNRLRGNGGADTLAGGGGDDTLHGGFGADRFFFARAGDGVDVVEDFNRAQGDRLAFLRGNFGGLPAGAVAAGRFRASADGAAGDADDRFLFASDSRVLSYDADGAGAGAAVAIARINVADLRAADLLLVNA